MTKAIRGISAGFAATMVLSVIMIAKSMMGLMPELNVIEMLSTTMKSAPAMAWLAHFMIGVLAWGGGFVLLSRALPGKTNLAKGISFGIAAWVVMMIVVMPMTGAGYFGLNIGMRAPAMTLMLHLIYGAVLGFVYGNLGCSSCDARAKR